MYTMNQDMQEIHSQPPQHEYSGGTRQRTRQNIKKTITELLKRNVTKIPSLPTTQYVVDRMLTGTLATGHRNPKSTDCDPSKCSVPWYDMAERDTEPVSQWLLTFTHLPMIRCNKRIKQRTSIKYKKVQEHTVVVHTRYKGTKCWWNINKTLNRR